MSSLVEAKHVAVFKQNSSSYSENPPFHPPELYPEAPFHHTIDPTNEAYRSIRSSLRLLGFDPEHFGQANWNPLRKLINPGDVVLIKPNLIAHTNKNNDDWQSLLTHGSIIRAVVDYVYIALNGIGRIVIADAPQEDSDIDQIKDRIRLDSIQELYSMYKNFAIEFIDLRNQYFIMKNGIPIRRVRLPGDPLGAVRVNLGEHSHFAENDFLNKRYYGANYDLDETNRHHGNGTHEYLLSRTALESDVFISLPKLKTHKKVGITLNLKNLVGINSDKNWLPHYAVGSPEENGDQFASRTLIAEMENKMVLTAKELLLKKIPFINFIARRTKAVAYRIFGDTEQVIRSGNWHGNDTCWRMTLDLNRILFYGNPDGTLMKTPKRYFSIVDGIVGMAGNGPVAGKPQNASFIISGRNPVAVDLVCAKLMGFNYQKMPMLYRALDKGPYQLADFPAEEILISSNRDVLQGKLGELSQESMVKFEPHFGWKGHVEL